MSADDHDAELRAVAERYARRAPGDRYSPLRPEVVRALHERQAATLALLAAHAPGTPASLRALEVGCGQGDNLLDLLRWGFVPSQVAGNDLLPERLAAARIRLPPAVALHAGDATVLPVAEGSLDLALQFTVFSSILDDAVQQRLASAMWRWVRPGGAVLWYDFTFDNPRNADVRGVPLARIRQLFPQGRITAKRVTLAPPLARAVVRVHPALYTVFNALPLLRTHLLCWIAKP